MSNLPENQGKTPPEGMEFVFLEQGQEQKKPETEADHLHAMLKPLHNLPRGKNTWDPKFIKVWWFWPASVAFLLALYYVYPMILDYFSS